LIRLRSKNASSAGGKAESAPRGAFTARIFAPFHQATKYKTPRTGEEGNGVPERQIGVDSSSLTTPLCIWSVRFLANNPTHRKGPPRRPPRAKRAGVGLAQWSQGAMEAKEICAGPLHAMPRHQRTQRRGAARRRAKRFPSSLDPFLID